MLLGRAKPEGLAYLEAVRAFARRPTHAMGRMNGAQVAWAGSSIYVSVFSIEGWRQLIGQADVADSWRVRWFWGLTWVGSRYITAEKTNNDKCGDPSLRSG
jgi:hypothetical protein